MGNFRPFTHNTPDIQFEGGATQRYRAVSVLEDFVASELTESWPAVGAGSAALVAGVGGVLALTQALIHSAAHAFEISEARPRAEFETKLNATDASLSSLFAGWAVGTVTVIGTNVDRIGIEKDAASTRLFGRIGDGAAFSEVDLGADLVDGEDVVLGIQVGDEDGVVVARFYVGSELKGTLPLDADHEDLAVMLESGVAAQAVNVDYVVATTQR